MTPTTLADRFRNVTTHPKGIKSEFLIASLQRAKRYVLDDKATVLAVDLSHSNPRHMADMLETLTLLHDDIWFEMPSQTLLKAKAHFSPHKSEDRPKDARTALLISRHNTGLKLWCIEDSSDSLDGTTFAWPISFDIAQAGTFTSFMAPDATQEAWGYLPTAGSLNRLLGSCQITAHPSFAARLGSDGIHSMAQELSGLPRLAIALLTMLTHVADISPAQRPQGLVRHNGTLTNKLSTHTLTYRLPKRIRNPLAYVRGQVASHHKRLHEVAPHYRHLTYRPSTPGWEPVIIADSTYYRKLIPPHLRGNPDLGVVTHDHTRITA